MNEAEFTFRLRSVTAAVEKMLKQSEQNRRRFLRAACHWSDEQAKIDDRLAKAIARASKLPASKASDSATAELVGDRS